MIGIVGRCALPAPYSAEGPDSVELVPSIHIIQTPQLAYPRPLQTPMADPAKSSTRDELVHYLATAFDPPDLLAGEILLLLLISAPTARPNGVPPLGVLSVNLQRSTPDQTAKLESIVSSVWPVVVNIPLSLSFLHSARFAPASSDSATLDAGVLQLADDTVVIIEEDAMGQGGQLADKAVKNLEHLSNCIKTQTLRYEYPFMDSLRMDTSIKSLILSEAKSLLPVRKCVQLDVI